MQTLRNLQLPRKHLKCKELQPQSELSNQKEDFGKYYLGRLIFCLKR